jgi:hypothetical protein
VQARVAVGGQEKGGARLGVAHRCGRTAGAVWVSVMAWREGCGQVLAKLTPERRMATEARSTEEMKVLTFSSCDGRTGRPHRASANATWVARSDLKSSGRRKEKACGSGCTG